MTHSYAWHDSPICVTRLTYIGDMTYSSRWYDSLKWVTWPMTPSYVWHDSLRYETWLIHIWDMTHALHYGIWDMPHSLWMCSSICYNKRAMSRHMGHASHVPAYETCLIHYECAVAYVIMNEACPVIWDMRVMSQHMGHASFIIWDMPDSLLMCSSICYNEWGMSQHKGHASFIIWDMRVMSQHTGRASFIMTYAIVLQGGADP